MVLAGVYSFQQLVLSNLLDILEQIWCYKMTIHYNSQISKKLRWAVLLAYSNFLIKLFTSSITSLQRPTSFLLLYCSPMFKSWSPPMLQLMKLLDALSSNAFESLDLNSPDFFLFCWNFLILLAFSIWLIM